MFQPPDEHDPFSEVHLERENRFTRNARVRFEDEKQQKGKQCTQYHFLFSH